MPCHSRAKYGYDYLARAGPTALAVQHAYIHFASQALGIKALDHLYRCARIACQRQGVNALPAYGWLPVQFYTAKGQTGYEHQAVVVER